MSEDTQPHCLSCDRTEHELPLLAVRYHGRQAWICPDCLPRLIHRRAELEDQLARLAAQSTRGSTSSSS